MRIALDFDKTIAAGPTLDPEWLVPGVEQSMQHLHRAGHHLTVWSCRNGRVWGDLNRAESLQKMKAFLDAHNLPYDAIDYGDQGKLLADLYVDDKALGVPLRTFRGNRVVDWPIALKMIRLLVVGSRL